MALIEKETTYATAEYADSYINAYRMTYDPQRVHWSVLTNAEKEGYLLRSLNEIEQLSFIGRKHITTQKLAFPRTLYPGGVLYTACFTYDYDDTILPEAVKQAQVENALGILNKEISAISDKQFMSMQALGAVKNTKYNKREAGDLGFGEDITGGSSASKSPLTSAKAYALLRGWVGSITIC